MTTAPPFEPGKMPEWIVILALKILSVLAVTVNIFCLIIVIKTKNALNKPSTIFIITLLSTHLLQGVLTLPLYVAKRTTPRSSPTYRYVCDGFRFTYIITFYTTCLTMLIISIDRLLATRHIYSYRKLVTPLRAKAITVLISVYMLIICCIPFIPFHHLNSQPGEIVKKEACSYNYPRWWTTAMITSHALLPYVLSIFCHLLVIRNLRKSFKIVQNSTKRNSKKPVTRTTSTDSQKAVEGHVTKITMVLSLTYGILWGPCILYFALMSVCQICFSKKYFISTEEQYIGFFVKFFVFCDAVAGPIIYCLNHKDFRKTAYNLVVPKKYRSQDIEERSTSLTVRDHPSSYNNDTKI